MKYDTLRSYDIDAAVEQDLRQHRRERQSVHNLILYSLLALLLFLNVLLLASWHALGLHIPTNGVSSKYYAFENTTLFDAHAEYESFSPDHDGLWHALQSPNGGFLVKELDDGFRHNFGIAMFHQLHCLQNLREGLQLLGFLANGTWSVEEVIEKTDMAHFGHCVDYLRQSILCAADDTLEAPLTAVNSLDMITGHNVLHQCRNRDAVWRMSVNSGYIDPDMPFDIPEEP